MAAGAAWRWTALRSLLVVALLHRLDCLAFLAASSPVWLLAAFLLGIVLVHSEPNNASSEDQDRRRHLYKKIRHLTADSSSLSSEEDDNFSSSSSSSSAATTTIGGMADQEEPAGDKEEVVKVTAWTADDEHSIQSIGSLELERDARLEKLMSRRSIHRRINLIDLDDVHIPVAVSVSTNKNPCCSYDDPGSAPSSLLGHHTNPFDFDIHQRGPAEMMTRHESFTAHHVPSRFRPYFVAESPGGDAGRDNSNNSSSSSSSSSPSSSSGASDHHQLQQAARGVVVEEEPPPPPAAPAPATLPPRWDDGKKEKAMMAVDVELISDSSDDDMSLPGGGDNALNESDEEDSFEVESITQQVAAAGIDGSAAAGAAAVEIMVEDASLGTRLPSVEENQTAAVPVNIDRSTSAADAACAVIAAPPPPPAAEPAPSPPISATSGKPNSKSKTASNKKAVFGFFRK